MYFMLFLEFGRILGEADVKKTMSLAWENIWSVKIISLAKREQHGHGIKCLLKHVEVFRDELGRLKNVKAYTQLKRDARPRLRNSVSHVVFHRSNSVKYVPCYFGGELNNRWVLFLSWNKKA